MPKETHYFERYWDEDFTQDDIIGYRRYFPRPDDLITGEWTTLYMHDPWVLPLLALAAPETKILVLLRDPVERYISGLAHDLSHGAPRSAMLASTHFSRGCYMVQLQRLFRFFDRGQVLILQYEGCVSDVEAELRKTYGFLGLQDCEYTPVAIRSEVNKSLAKPSLHPAARGRLVAEYEEQVRSLLRNCPEIDVGLWPNFAYLADGASGDSDVKAER